MDKVMELNLSNNKTVEMWLDGKLSNEDLDYIIWDYYEITFHGEKE